MAKIKDITNQKFENLIALYKTDKKGADGSYLWHCKCDCGNECDVNGSNLRSGHTTSCGCKRKIISAQNGKKTINNIKGQKFGKLTVLEQTSERKNGNIVWKCKCDCGNIKYVRSQSLIDGGTKSCGCLGSVGEEKIIKILSDNNIVFESQKTFNNCKFKDTNALAKFDFYVNNQYLIEFDGEQHFKNSEYFGGIENFNKIQEHDKIKNQWCKENNIPLIRIPYTHLENLCIEDLQLETSNFIYKGE